MKLKFPLSPLGGLIIIQIIYKSTLLLHLIDISVNLLSVSLPYVPAPIKNYMSMQTLFPSHHLNSWLLPLLCLVFCFTITCIGCSEWEHVGQEKEEHPMEIFYGKLEWKFSIMATPPIYTNTWNMMKNKSTQQKKQRKEDGNPSGRPRPQSQRPRSLSEFREVKNIQVSL